MLEHGIGQHDGVRGHAGGGLHRPQHPLVVGHGVVQRLQDAVVKDSIIPMLAQMYRTSGINPRRIYRMVIAGNTTMNHLLAP